MRPRSVIFTLRAFILFSLAVSAGAAPQAVGAGLYTRDQAAEGRKLYTSTCASCHGRELEGASSLPLTGPRFTARWELRPVDDLFFLMRSTMPPGANGSLSPGQHAAVLAYVLERNGHASGATPLEVNSPRLKQTLLGRDATSTKPSTTEAPAFIQGNAAPVAGGAGPTQEELNSAHRSTRDWLYHTHDYSGSRYVALDRINSTNASRLQTACVFQVGEISNFQTGPIVYRGTMFVTTLQSTIALDAANCRPKWRHTWDPKGPNVWPSNRGVAIKDGRVVRGTSDGYLFALNAQTGELLWARKAANTAEGETFTMPPLIFEDLILIGPAGSENGISGWVGAFKLADGAEVWRFKTVPGAREGGSASWPNPSGILLGGGAVWTPFSLDPEKAELYVAVTNPAPDLPAHLRLGDNLYTNSMVVLDVRTGALRWHKQMVVNDSHDYDLTQVSPLYKTTVNGRQASLVATVGKDGILRTVDRNSREILYRTPITTVKKADVPVTTKGVHACPGVLGGVEWNGPAYSPVTNLLYVPAVDWCSTFTAAETVRLIPGRNFMGGSIQRDATSQGWITAVDASTGDVRWKYRSARPVVGAVTATSGNVLFAGELTGDFLALDARTGGVLYRFNTGGAIGGGIVTYELGGRQFVAVMSGRPSRFWVDQNPGAPTVLVFAVP